MSFHVTYDGEVVTAYREYLGGIGNSASVYRPTLYNFCCGELLSGGVQREGGRTQGARWEPVGYVSIPCGPAEGSVVASSAVDGEGSEESSGGVAQCSGVNCGYSVEAGSPGATDDSDGKVLNEVASDDVKSGKSYRRNQRKRRAKLRKLQEFEKLAPISCDRDVSASGTVAASTEGSPLAAGTAIPVTDSGCLREQSSGKPLEVPEWRRKKPFVVGGAATSHTGYFSGCRDDLVKELKETRMRAMIAKNVREEMDHKKAVDRMSSPVAMITEAIKTIELAGRCAQKSNDNHVAGWAETVAQSYAESIARTASEKSPSTVPSLESVPFDAELSSEERVKQRKKMLYEKRLEQLDEDCEELNMNSWDYDCAKANLEDEFEDVLFKPEELVERKMKRKILDVVGGSLMASSHKEELFKKLEFPEVDYQHMLIY